MIGNFSCIDLYFSIDFECYLEKFNVYINKYFVIFKKLKISFKFNNMLGFLIICYDVFFFNFEVCFVSC